MKPISIRLKNFRTIDDFTYHFHPGVTGVMGPNFAGKSNFSELGTRFAWLGTTPSGLNKKDLLQWEKSEGSTEWIFEHGGEEYTIKRDVHGSGVSMMWGSEELTDHESVRDRLEEIMGIDLALVSEYCFVPQFALTDILQMTRSARLEYFLQLVNRAGIKKRRDLLQKASSAIPVHPDRTEEIEVRKDRLKHIGEDLTKHLETLQNLQNGYSRERLDEIVRLLAMPSEEDLENKRKEIRKDLADLEDRRKSLKAPEPGPEPPEVTEEQKQFLRWKAVEGEYGALVEELGSLVVPELPEPPDALRTRLEDIKREHDALKEPLEKYSKGVCPECLRPFEDAKEKVEELTSKKEELLAEFNKLKPEYHDARDKYNEAVSARDAVRERKRVLEQRKAVLEASRIELEDTVENIEEISGRREAWLERKRAYDKMSEQHTAIREKKAALEAKMQVVDETEPCPVPKADLVGEKGSLEETARSISELEKEIHGLQVTRKEVRGERDRLIKEQQDRGRADEAVQFLDRARDILHKDRLPSLVLEDRRHFLNSLLEKNLEILESGFTSYINKEFDFRVNFENGKTDRPVKELSAGQRVMLSAVFHLSKLKVLPQVPFLVLDEPTPYVGKNNLITVAELFSRFSRENPDTYVLVPTHDTELTGCFDRILRVEPKEV